MSKDGVLNRFKVLSRHSVEGTDKSQGSRPRPRCEAGISRLPRQQFVLLRFRLLIRRFYAQLKIMKKFVHLSACRCCHTRHNIVFWQGTPPLRGAMRQRDANPQYENSFLQHVSQMTIRILTVKYYTIFRWKLGVWDARRIKNCKN